MLHGAAWLGMARRGEAVIERKGFVMAMSEEEKREYHRKYNLDWYHKNREKVLQKGRDRREKNPNYHREYHLNHYVSKKTVLTKEEEEQKKISKKEMQKKYREDHKDFYKEYDKEWRKKNPEKRKEYILKSAKKRKEKRREDWLNRFKSMSQTERENTKYPPALFVLTEDQKEHNNAVMRKRKMADHEKYREKYPEKYLEQCRLRSKRRREKYKAETDLLEHCRRLYGTQSVDEEMKKQAAIIRLAIKTTGGRGEKIPKSQIPEILNQIEKGKYHAAYKRHS